MTESRPMPRHFAGVASALLRAFRQRRPLRAGSLITTVFGDSLAARHCEVSLSSLIRLLAPFGLTDRLVRTSIGRLAQEDWVSAQRIGRLSFYRLSAAGAERFAAATRRIYAAPSEEWRGCWTTLIVPGETDRATRERIREALRWSGFGQLAAGVHIHPLIDVADAARLVADCGAGITALIMQSRNEGSAADRRMIKLGWDLNDLERRYVRFIKTFAPALRALQFESAPEPQHCFHMRTLLIHEYRKVHLLDPLLPKRLLPGDWAGGSAYELCKNLYLGIAERSDQFVQSMLSTSSGVLPAPAIEASLRFRTATSATARTPAPQPRPT